MGSSSSSTKSKSKSKSKAEEASRFSNLEEQRLSAHAKADDFWDQLVEIVNGADHIHYLNKSDGARRIDILRISKPKNKCSRSNVRLKFCILDPGRNSLFNGDMDDWIECVRLLHSRRLTPKSGFYQNIPLVAVRDVRCTTLWLYLHIDFRNKRHGMFY
jgi:hypothetical protein